MDIYDTRRANLALVIRELNMSYAKFGKLVGYNGAYIGQLLNRTKRSKGGDALVTDKVVGKVLAAVKNLAPAITRETFDKERGASALVNAATELRESAHASLQNLKKQMVEEKAVTEAMLVEEDRFVEHLSSTWPYMSDEQRAAIRYLEAGFRKQRVNKR